MLKKKKLNFFPLSPIVTDYEFFVHFQMRHKMNDQNVDVQQLKSVRHVSCLADHSRELFKINANPSIRVYESVENPEENVEENNRRVS